MKQAVILVGLVALILMTGCTDYEDFSEGVVDSYRLLGEAAVDTAERELERQHAEREARAAEGDLRIQLLKLRVGMTRREVRALCGYPADITSREWDDPHEWQEAWFYGNYRMGRVMVWFHREPQVIDDGALYSPVQVVYGEDTTVESIHRY